MRVRTGILGTAEKWNRSMWFAQREPPGMRDHWARSSGRCGIPVCQSCASAKWARGLNDIHGEGRGPSQRVMNSSTAARTVFRAETSSEKRYSERPQSS